MRTPFFKPTLSALLLVVTGLLAPAGAVAAARSSPAKDDFMPYVQLAPFVVQGRQLTISVHARSKGDRRYAERFAGEVVKVVYESVTEETGKGLVIIGRKGEPHPIFVFRKFLALAREGKLDSAVAARGPELNSMLNHWQHTVGDGPSAEAGGEGGVDMEFEQIVTALPLPLDGVGAMLYQLAWREDFDETRVEAKLRALRPADLEGNLFARFDWVFYLPPRGAFEQALDRIIADSLKEDNEGFFVRTLVKGAMLVVKPKIRQAIEAMRCSVLFSTVVRAGTDFTEEQVDALTDAYLEVLMPDFDHERDADQKTGSEHDRAVGAVRAMLHDIETGPAAKAL